ncbi:ubiquinol oxidase subunit II [Rhizobium tumorigenes]|uniref:Ubiquinol oxidase subunit 2 n=1 Tax=Rhizobium tumorigenes TaxID=2041385 RepID=A0AAF1KFM6_9HYPH|nr:ubiquinol oxidase subunit II [Rhizobium tumorigenes]WFR95298.1 ubiquinol oxidase subunit II [Rhizobium tumorigenes]
MHRASKIFSRLSALSMLVLLAGCNMVVMAPSGDIAVQQRDLIVISTVLMLLIIIPVIFLIFFFGWKYRQSNTDAKYDPDWHHSTRLEVMIWSAPLVIIIALGAVTWISTHKLDPYRPLDRIDSATPLAKDVKPMTVEVVALDWKWLFFYPDLGIATVNELAAPVNTPINFKITSGTVMNSFYIPALAGQIYAMAGMETKLHAVINKPGEFEGISANYSGAGFSNMRFKFHGLDQAAFDQWVQKAKSQGKVLDTTSYAELAKPSIKDPVQYFSSVGDGLYNSILNMCATPGKMCMNEMMHIDASGGAGKESQENREKLIHDNRDAANDVAPATMDHGDTSMPGMDMGNGSAAPATPSK